jgi:hyperosmotically inducible protein
MRRTSTLFISSTAFVLALTLATGAYAQQSTPGSAATAMPADNSGMNQRDAASQNMRPEDQPNDKTDIKLAAKVRRAIVNDKTLSTSAHNVKLIAANGVVSLRGPVASADEKAKIESDVSAIPGVSRVDNQLDVKTP